ncbi:type 1 fimbrial protein [Serratia fonticola]|uniref:fimbrial protein n=1 Tax=Serratia fonticola TaxID=47917 RepID=UPI0015C61300|nr:fimbrial protein [Serratia fonticola]MBC3378345.1 type 1 fimbrial protein [Serratia fonticola]NYA37545.1 type 1 fimbrial protein [Serratia fonticola]
MMKNYEFNLPFIGFFMKFNVIVALLLSGIFSVMANAENVVINGRIVASPCTVDAKSTSQTVDFGRVKKSDMQQTGNAGKWQPFQVTLINCPKTTSRVSAFFTGTPFSDDTMLYGSSGTATGIAVQVVQDGDKSQLQGIGSTMVVDVDQVNHSATFALSARLFSPNGDIAPGNVNSLLMMSFTYQ